MPGSDRPRPRADAVTERIVECYAALDEGARLGRDIGPLEEAHTRDVYRRFLPDPPAAVCDVGGGTGAYAFWLAGLGYTVDLVDLVPRHIEQAEAQQATLECGRLRTLCVGDARKLDLPDGAADALILNGPLYHHVERAERVAILAEARRVLRPNGVLLAVAISRYAGALARLVTPRIWDPVALELSRCEITTGVRDLPASARNAQAINTAYFHEPDELSAEIACAGLEVVARLGLVGPAWLVPDLEASFADPVRREVILELARLFEREPVLAPRILAVCRPRH